MCGYVIFNMEVSVKIGGNNLDNGSSTNVLYAHVYNFVAHPL